MDSMQDNEIPEKPYATYWAQGHNLKQYRFISNDHLGINCNFDFEQTELYEGSAIDSVVCQMSFSHVNLL